MWLFLARGSLWVLPLAGALLGPGLMRADRSVRLPPYWTYSPPTGSTVLSAIVGAMTARTGFVVTGTVLVVQMATARSRDIEHLGSAYDGWSSSR